jgi:hypothetical protein
MTFAKVMMVVRKLEDLKQKVWPKIGNNTSRGTFYEMGSRFKGPIKPSSRLIVL